MQIGNFIIRQFQPQDQQQVINLWSVCKLIAVQNDPVSDIQRKLKVNPEWFLVGEIAGKVIATCMAGYDGHRGWINYLAVHPDYQRQGFGTQIMRKAEELLREVDCPKINLQIRTSNKAVIQFYKSVGFTIDDVISMGKRLAGDG